MGIFKQCGLIVLSILSLISSNVTHAEKSHQQKYEETMGKQLKVKCFVEFSGGGSDIRYVVGAFKEPNQARGKLAGRKVPIGYGKKDKTILKVKECVIAEGKFKSSFANSLDKIAPK